MKWRRKRRNIGPLARLLMLAVSERAWAPDETCLSAPTRPLRCLTHQPGSSVPVSHQRATFCCCTPSKKKKKSLYQDAGSFAHRGGGASWTLTLDQLWVSLCFSGALFEPLELKIKDVIVKFLCACLLKVHSSVHAFQICTQATNRKLLSNYLQSVPFLQAPFTNYNRSIEAPESNACTLFVCVRVCARAYSTNVVGSVLFFI